MLTANFAEKIKSYNTNPFRHLVAKGFFVSMKNATFKKNFILPMLTNKKTAMKSILKLFALALLLQSFQCDDDNHPDPITPEQLNLRKQEIVGYIDSFECENSENCNTIALGVKPCGGPTEFLTFPSSVDLNELESMIEGYNQLNTAYNIQTNAVSDCAVVLPPQTVECENGGCTIVD